MHNTQAEIIEALIFKMKRLELVLDAAKGILRDGIAGRGQVIDGAQTVEIKHDRWLALLDAVNQFP